MNNVLSLVITFLMEIAGFLFMARFLLQACRADFYNPISQGIIKVTDPVLKPLRVVIPAFRNLDLASFVAAWIIAGLMLYALGAFAGRVPVDVVYAIVGGLLHVLLRFLSIFFWCILIVIIASYFVPANPPPVLGLLRQITEPILAPARRLLPAMGGLDFSPILVILALEVLRGILPDLFSRLY